jgi:dinuclear metal center YbgI/SA1388 family protein
MQIQDLIRALEQFAPPAYQESYDNAGLITGNPKAEATGVLIALDSIETVLDEAIALGCNVVVAHHPIVFKGLKQIQGRNYVERVIIKAIKHDIALYAIHTNLDNVAGGVNFKIAEVLGLEQIRILAPKSQVLMKLTTFVPVAHTDAVLKALGDAGAGQIGAYKNCSFAVEGVGKFLPTAQATPHIGTVGELESVQEHRIEVILPTHLQGNVLRALREAHPYEEVAYYLHALENQHQEIGSGAIGVLPTAMQERDFLAYLKARLQLSCIRHTALVGKEVKTVALCGGTGSFLLNTAIRQGADVFISADFKYHEFFDADNRIVIADIGHYESEISTTKLLYDFLKARFEALPLHITTVNTNPIQYFYI